MSLLVLGLLIEAAVVIALWRVTKQSPSWLASIFSVTVGLAAGCSIGLAAQCCYLVYGPHSVIRPDSQFMVFWLVMGVLGFAVAMRIRPTQTSSSIPCLFLALLCLGYAWYFGQELWIAVALALALTAALLWLMTSTAVCRRWLNASSCETAADA